MLPILLQIQNSMIVPLDRWRVIIQGQKGKVQKIMNNYFSIGPDAGLYFLLLICIDIAIGFHTMRNERPELFKSRAVNKMWYAFYGSKLLGKEEVPLREIIDLEVHYFFSLF